LEDKAMIRGFITARHIILHPVTLIACLGLSGYAKLLIKCMDSRIHGFTDFLMMK
jgi:hypothetical protein